jgi:hypothetical protein
MNPYQTYNSYIDRYGEEEGKQLFIQYCEFMSEVEPFPTCLVWCDMIRQILNKEI